MQDEKMNISIRDIRDGGGEQLPYRSCSHGERKIYHHSGLPVMF
jgi:hypothetical protein